MSIERANNDEQNSTFRAENSDNQESRIGKPEQSFEATPEDKIKAQEKFIQQTEARIDEMKKNLARVEQGQPLQNEYVSKSREAEKKEDELEGLIRDQIQNDKPEPDPRATTLEQEIKQLRDESATAREQFHQSVPAEARSQDLFIYTNRLKEDIQKQEEDLQSNIKELEEMKSKQ